MIDNGYKMGEHRIRTNFTFGLLFTYIIFYINM